MNKRVVTFMVLVIAMLTLLPMPVAFGASASSIVPIGGVANTCVMNGGGFWFPTSYTFTGTGSDTFQMTALGYGQLNAAFTQESTIGYPVGSGTSIYGTDSLYYSLPEHTTITLTITTFSGDNYTGSSSSASFDFDCTTGAGSGYQGPTIPTGFVLRTITCNTPVYDAAGGSPLITGEAVTAGQTWFVSPTVTAAGQSNWIEIFNSGASNGFVPAACVGGAPAGF